MIKFFSSFYAKLSGLFLILLLIMAALQLLITVSSWNTYYSEADQKLNLNLARDMASELKPLIADSLDLAAVEHAIHYMMVLNPRIEIYILDNAGRILAFFADPRKKVKADQVDLGPVNDFVNRNSKIPILGQDPRSPSVRKPFSAARLQIGGSTDNGYLYIVLGSEQFDIVIDAIRDSYLGRTMTRSLLVTLLFTGIIGLILFGQLTRRLRRMTSLVREFEKGQLDSRLPVNSGDELGQLSVTFNRMADTIRANINELKETDRIRRELIANVSHDLRSPLASLRGYIETIQMKDDQIDRSERQKYLAVLLDTARNLEQLVEELFELSKLDARQVKANPEPFALKDLIFDVIMKLKPQADEKSIKLEACVPDRLPQAYADIALIERVLTNLITNAIFYTPGGGRVTVSASADADKLHVMVSDTGRGIEQKELQHIFDRFYRVEKSRSENSGGTGLGLAIAQKIMEVHQSCIEVKSQLNVGTTFSFALETWGNSRN